MGEHHHWFAFIPGLAEIENAVGPHVPLAQAHNGHYSFWHVVMALFVVLLVTALLLKAGLNRLPAEERIVPEDRFSVRTFFELIIEAVLGLAKDIIGEKHAERFLPLLGTLAVFILFSNCLGLVPGMQPPTSTLNTTVACAIPVFLFTHYVGVREHGLPYFKHFFGPIIKWYALPLMIIMLLIETISHFARPLSLSLRLFGNMTGDHMVLVLFSTLILVGADKIPMAPLFPVPIMLLGLLVCIVQTLVFCLLSMVYFGLAVAHEEH